MVCLFSLDVNVAGLPLSRVMSTSDQARSLRHSVYSTIAARLRAVAGPRAALDVFRTIRAALTTSRWQGNYDTLADANAAIGSSGYRQNTAAFVAYARAIDGVNVEGIDMHILAALKLTGARTVLDYGGGLGNRYRSIREHIDVSWTVQELPELVSAGRAAFPDVRFVTDAVEEFDATLLCGVVQQVENWRDLLKQFRSRHLIIENVFTHNGATRVAVRAGYALRLFNACDVETQLRSIGTIVLSWKTPLAHEVLGQEHLMQRGYLVSRS